MCGSSFHVDFRGCVIHSLGMERNKFCRVCGVIFEAKSACHKYCSRQCETRSHREREGFLLAKGRHCRQCGTLFFPSFKTGANQQHCSKPCSIKSARESRSRFYAKNPNIIAMYRAKSRERRGPDGNQKRFFARYPNAPRQCEACGEKRVLDIAHKPGKERQGAWRSKANTQWPSMVWVLCPTCHALLDRMGYAPCELGLAQ